MYFNRGIICEHQLTIPEHVHPLEAYPLSIVKSNSDLPDIDFSWPSGLYFGDGSGGIHNHDNIRRCGVGITHVDNNAPHKPLYNMSMPLPGDIQTVPRAELTAVLVTVSNIEYFGTIDFFTDSEITKDTYYKGKHRAKHANNADLWTELFQLIDTKNIDLRIYWMPSHTADNPEKRSKAPDWMEDWHVKGNDMADVLAGQAADMHRVPTTVSAGINKIHKDLRLIQKRHIAVAKLWPRRDHNKVTPEHTYKPTYIDKIQEAAAESKHACIIQGSRIYCSVCNTNISIHACNIFDFLSSSCLEMHRTNPIPVGKKTIHHTHHKNIWWCLYMHHMWRHCQKEARETERPM